MTRVTKLALPAGVAEIDVALARLVHRLSEGDELLARTAALVSRERGLGHVCVHLRDHAGAIVDVESDRSTEATVARRFRWPEVPDWRRSLLESDLVADEHATRLMPLVLDAADRLYLSRYFRAERSLARGVSECATRARDAGPDELADSLFALLFASLFDGGDERVADQARAAKAALRGGLTLVSGGPGTGKTTTVARILVLLLAQNPELRIALAAPTGKAAARLGQSIAAGLAGLSSQAELADTLRRVFPHALDRVPTEARTLHRLLGYQPRRDRFRHRREDPLPFDVVVVDEASMVDLLMMNSLVEALAKGPDGASLILLGDRDQLASVEAGFVFGDLASAAVLRDGSADGDEAGPLGGCAVELRHSWRFAEQTGIGDLALAVRQGDAAETLSILDDKSRIDVKRHRPVDAETILAPLESSLVEYLASGDVETALERLAAFRILCATRVGPWGVDRVNLLVERYLAERGHSTSERFYPRRPILVQQNDYQSGLFNGDLGVCWQDGDRLRVVFPGPGDQPPRRLPLAKLPRHDTAWAMTVHKSQGSEFDHVLLVLPDDVDAARGVLSRELIYTGLTRARRRIDLVASDEVLRAALGRTSRRESGLVDALRGRRPDRVPGTPKGLIEMSDAFDDELDWE